MKSLNREILRLAIPNILSNLSVPLLGIVDTALMGHLEDPAYLGAIAVGSTIFSFLYWGMGFLRMGTTGLTSQAFGQQNRALQGMILAQASFVALIAGIIFIAIQVPIARFSIPLISQNAEIIRLAEWYFYVRIYAAPATIGLYALNGWFLGMQNAVIPMVLTIVSNAINIVLNFVFVYQYGMTADGVALATVIAQYVGFFLGIVLWMVRYRHQVGLPNWQALIDAAALKRFFQVNADIFVRTICLIFAFAFFNAQSDTFGAEILAANQVLLQFQNLMAYGVDGFAFAAESLVGRFKGAEDRVAFQRSLRLLFIWGIGVGLCFTLGYVFAGEWLIRQLTDIESVVSLAKTYLIWATIIPPIAAVAFMLDGAYIGATASRPMRNAMVISTFGIYLPVFYLVNPWWSSTGWGNHGLWFAMLIYMLARAASLGVLAPRYLRLGRSTK